MTMTADINLTDMEWNELRALAKENGVPVAKRKRVDIQTDLAAKLNAQPVNETVTWTEATEETPEQKRARLMAELAELNGGSSPTGGVVGQNYWTWTNNDLKTACLSRGIVAIGSTATREAQIAALQSHDFNQGIQPHPRVSSVEVVSNVTPTKSLTKSRKNSAGEPVQHCVFLRDQDGNIAITVHGKGKLTPNGRDDLPMEENAVKIMALFNGGNE